MVRFTGVLLAVLALAAPVGAQQAQPQPAGPPRMPMAEFKKLQAENKVLVIDVRDAQSYATGHIPGARSIPLGTLLDPANLAALKSSTKEIVLYCA
jgi:3-mercaptopyruvate sulfurtransferase SseA